MCVIAMLKMLSINWNIQIMQYTNNQEIIKKLCHNCTCVNSEKINHYESYYTVFNRSGYLIYYLNMLTLFFFHAFMADFPFFYFEYFNTIFWLYVQLQTILDVFDNIYYCNHEKLKRQMCSIFQQKMWYIQILVLFSFPVFLLRTKCWFWSLV